MTQSGLFKAPEMLHPIQALPTHESTPFELNEIAPKYFWLLHESYHIQGCSLKECLAACIKCLRTTTICTRLAQRHAMQFTVVIKGPGGYHADFKQHSRIWCPRQVHCNSLRAPARKPSLIETEGPGVASPHCSHVHAGKRDLEKPINDSLLPCQVL
eukprot:709445-Pelagomonas_calceolata.AAC.1